MASAAAQATTLRVVVLIGVRHQMTPPGALDPRNHADLFRVTLYLDNFGDTLSGTPLAQRSGGDT